jgi:hypothetical protein
MIQRLGRSFPLHPHNHWEAGFRAGMGVATLVWLGICLIALGAIR